MKLAIAIPTYNEAANIKKLLPAIRKNLQDCPGLRCTVFVIDDSSPDGTAAIGEELGEKLKTPQFSVTVLSRKKKDGLGKAYIYAFRKIMERKFDFIAQMDADLSHDPIYLPAFVKAAEDHDLVVGSRYVPGGETPDWSLSRRLQSKGGNIYTRLLLGNKISDYTGGYNMYAAGLMKTIDPSTIYSSGYGFLIDLKFQALRHANAVYQVPIIFRDRQHGKSKLPRSTIIKNLLLVPRLRLQAMRNH